MRLVFVAAAGLTIALLWSVYEGKRAHALDVAAPIAPVTTPVAGIAEPITHAAPPVTRTVTNTVTPVVGAAKPVVQPVVPPVVHALSPVVQPLVDTVAPVLRPATGFLTPLAPPPFIPPAVPAQETAPRGPSATAVAQAAGDASAMWVRHVTSTMGSFPSLSLAGIPGSALPLTELPALPASFPSSVPLPHVPGGLGRTSGGGLAVLLAAAAVASLRGRRFRFATGVGQSIFLASSIERPG